MLFRARRDLEANALQSHRVIGPVSSSFRGVGAYRRKTRLAHAGRRNDQNISTLDGRLDDLALLATEVSFPKGCEGSIAGQQARLEGGSSASELTLLQDPADDPPVKAARSA